MNFSKVPRDKKPAHTMLLPTRAFADDWRNKPATDVCAGLRLVSQRDVDSARREAERVAAGFYLELKDSRGKQGVQLQALDADAALATRDEELMVRIVAYALCDPNDSTRPYFDFPEDTTRVALTPEGVRLVWDEYVMMSIRAGVGRYAADDNEVRRIGRILAAVGSGGITADDEIRKVCGHLLCRFADVADVPVAADDEDDDQAVYVARAI